MQSSRCLWSRPATHHAKATPSSNKSTLEQRLLKAAPSRPRRPAPAPRAAVEEAADDIEYAPDEAADTYFDKYTHRREGGGYTPFEFVSFSDIPLRHEVEMRVEAPAAKCYAIWEDRLNWMQWFDMIEEVGFHEEDPDLISMFLWYRWATTPFLELYVTLRRTSSEANKHIMEEPVDGAPIVAAVLFEEQGPEVTLVRFRLSYLLPNVLKDFAGKLAVWGDVDRKLQASMERMRAFVEGVDMAELAEARSRDWQVVQEGFPEQRRLREEEEMKEKATAEAFWQRAEELRRQEEEAAELAAAPAGYTASTWAQAAQAQAQAAAAAQAGREEVGIDELLAREAGGLAAPAAAAAAEAPAPAPAPRAAEEGAAAGQADAEGGSKKVQKKKTGTKPKGAAGEGAAGEGAPAGEKKRRGRPPKVPKTVI